MYGDIGLKGMWVVLSGDFFLLAELTFCAQLKICL